MAILPAAGLMTLTSCSSEEVVAPGEVNGNFAVSVKISNAGIAQTRAGGETLAALERERTIGTLYAVVFTDNGGPADQQTLYRVIPMTGSGADWQFEMGESGKYMAYFVANPGDGTAAFHYPGATVAPTEESSLEARLLALEEGVATPADLKNLTTTQSSGNGETVEEADITYDKFLMFSKTATRIVTARDYTSHITVALERASARIDVLNQADNVRIEKIELHNDVVQSYVYTPADGFDGQHSLYKHDLVTRDLTRDAETSANGGLVGSSTTPTQYAARIYTYEHLVGNDGNYHADTRPYVTLTYSTTEDNGNTWTAAQPLEVNFKDYSNCKDEDGKYDVEQFETAPDMSVMRNHLYRIRLTTDPNAPVVIPVLEVLDWEEAEEFQTEVEGANPTQAVMNARLWVNRFGETVAEHSDLDNGIYTPSSVEGYHSAYAFNEAAWLVTNADGSKSSALFNRPGYPQQYRIPTPGEMALLFPLNRNASTDYTDVFGVTLHDEPVTVDEGGNEVRFTRFTGSEQCAAYRIKYDLEGDEHNIVSVTIIALDKEGNLLKEDGTKASMLTQDALRGLDFDGIEHLRFRFAEDNKNFRFFTSELTSSNSLIPEMTIVSPRRTDHLTIDGNNALLMLVTVNDTHATLKP